jgi:hypothetical protein
MAEKERVKSTMGGSKKAKKKSKGKKKSVKEMHIRHAANGGYIVKHDLEKDSGGMPQEAEEHQVGDMNELQDHVADHMAEQPQAAQAQPAAAAPVGM